MNKRKKYITNQIFWLFGKQINLNILDYNDLFWLQALLTSLRDNSFSPRPKIGDYDINDWLSDIELRLKQLEKVNGNQR